MAPPKNRQPGGGESRILSDRYVLTELIGRGGMGTVFAAHDEWEQRKVAVKLIKDRRASEGRAWRMFSRELRAVLKLSHPGIVSVFDYGVDDEGLPFFVMEYVPGLALGALAEDPLRWMDVVDIFEQILETLAYAHARGIIHRDIKPDNFLIAPGDGRPRLKLVDFGIAKLLGEGSLERRTPEKAAETLTDLATNFTLSDSTVGTPAYMAPELGLNDIHLIGPQTDLYSVGCMLFEFVAGERPFDGRNIVSIIFSHCSTPVPTLQRRDGQNVPIELERLVRSLLEKDARKRPWCAMDVLDQLHRVPDFELVEGSSLEPVESRVLPQLLERTGKQRSEAGGQDDELDTPTSRDMLGETQLDPDAALRIGDAEAPTLLVDTGDETVADDSFELTVPVYRDTTPIDQRTGEFDAPAFVTRLGVAALRQPRLVGREPEQFWLVEHAREAFQTGVPKLLGLRGPRGIGRRRLANWVCEEFAERGACRVLKLCYIEAADEHDVLRRAIRGALGVGEDDDVVELLGKLPGSEALSSFPAAARYLLGPDGGSSGARIPVGLITGLLNMVRRGKPLMLLVENVQGSPDQGLPDLILAALRRGSDWPWPLLVVTNLPEQLDVGDDALEELLGHERSHIADLSPLSTRTGRELLQSLLPLRDAAADRIAEYAGGSPDVMLQLLRSLGASGDIYASGGQYWVKPDAWDDLTDVDDVYAASVDRLIDGLSESRGRLVLIAALVGMEPDIELLDTVVDRLGYDFDTREAVDALLEEGVFVGTEAGGIRFSHALMREAWQKHAVQRDDYRAWQRAIGRELERGDATRGRVGLHLYESGDDDAFEFLMEGGEHALERGEYALASKYLTAARRAADQIELDLGAEVELGAGLGRLAIRRSSEQLFGAAIDTLEDLDGAHAEGWRAWIEGAWDARSGRLKDARHAFEAAAEAFEREGSSADVLRARESLADTLRKAGDYPGAEQEARQALALAESMHSHRSMTRLLDLLGFICLETERYEEAADFARCARHRGDATADRSELARSLKIECGALMRLDRLDEAFERGREALTIFRELGDSVGELSMLNLLAMLRHEHAAFGQARQYALEALELSEQIGEQALRGRILNNLAHACEALGRKEEARNAYVRALRWSHESSDLQNEARVCFNLTRLVRASRPEWAIVLIERSRRILESLELPYLRESERVLGEITDELGEEHLSTVLSDFDERLTRIRNS
ncbi:MAG: protein kinase domain-containing protein [Myxococcota bacterium]